MSKNKQLPDFFINAFYESKFRDNLFVLKASGDVVENEAALNTLTSDIRDLTLQGIKVLLIYGGGKAMDTESQNRGIDVEKVGGRRINKAENIDVLKHVVGGDLSLSISAAMTRNNLDGISLNALPANWADINLAPKTPKDEFTGGIKRVHARPINRLFKSANFIACACIGITQDGDICNINADTIATQLSIGVKASKLIYLSNVDGVQVNDETAFMITASEIQGLIDDGTVSGGMKVKMENCLHALESGVNRIHLINGLREHALRKEIYESFGPGTMLLQDEEQQNYVNEMEIQKLIEAQS
jgi:acetylglutamate kinase